MIKIILLGLTVVLGVLYTRKELKALFQCINDGDYIEWRHLTKIMARRESGLY